MAVIWRAITGAIVPLLAIPSASGASLQLRCDHLSGSEPPAIISIDISESTVGRQQTTGTSDPLKETYVNNREYDAPREVEGDGPNYIGCAFQWKEFVTISDSEVTFGRFGVSINTCGYKNFTKPSPPGETQQQAIYKIERQLGVLTDRGGDRYQWEKLDRVF
jgi:hypothetical protein